MLGASFAIGVLECRLAADDRVDFQACTFADSAERTGMLAALRSHRMIGSELPVDPIWGAFERQVELWCNSANALYLSPSFWVELDLTSSGVRPFAFFAAPGALGRCGPTLLRALLAEDHSEVHALAQGAVGKDAVLRHFAYVSARQPKSVRLRCAVPLGDLPSHLACIGWPGSSARLLEGIHSLGFQHKTITFHVDVSQSVLPVIGIEFQYGHHEPDRWDKLFARLQQMGLATSEKLAACARWNGGIEGSELVHGLCIKVAFSEHVPVQAKAYLAASSIEEAVYGMPSVGQYACATRTTRGKPAALR